MRIATLSDVPLGYGSPQVVRLTTAVRDILDASAVVIAPKGDSAAARLAASADVDLVEIETADPIGLHVGASEFSLLAARILDAQHVDVVVLCAFLAAPALLFTRRAPRRVIYYGYEHTDGMMPRVEAVFASLAPRIDLAIFPEEHRAVLDGRRLSLGSTPTVIVYNGSETHHPTANPNARNGRLFYGGLIDPKRTYAEALFHGQMSRLPVDVWGRVEGIDPPPADNGQVVYHGLLPAGPVLEGELAQSVGALVMWAPITESTLYAAPNKFFEAIALGVPPVCTPHPLCKRIISRFQCGVIAPTFAPEDLRDSSLALLRSVGSAAYEEMVQSCVERAKPELSWGAQIRKIEAYVSRWKR